VVCRQNADNCRYPASKGDSRGNHFLAVNGDLSCMIASDTLFDSRSGFR